MKTVTASRRRDLIIGSLASALIVGTGAFLSGPHPLIAGTPPAVDPADPVLERPIPEDPVPVEITDPYKAPVHQEVSLPQRPDIPQPEKPGDIVQPVQPVSEKSIDTNRIPDGWNQPAPEGQVWDPARLDQQPVPRYQSAPLYPYEMKHAGMTGEVVVDFIVDTTGNVRNATVVRSTHHGFDEAAVAAVCKWKFRPGMRNGHAVFTHMAVPIQFTLEASR